MNVADKHGNTCLHLIFKKSAMHLLTKPGAQFRVLKALLAAGADTNVVNKYNKTPLHMACESNRDRCAALIASHPGISDIV